MVNEKTELEFWEMKESILKQYIQFLSNSRFKTQDMVFPLAISHEKDTFFSIFLVSLICIIEMAFWGTLC